jgi:hypothetical protein
MWDEDRKEFPDEASPRKLTFTDTIIVKTPPLLILQERIISFNDGGPIDPYLSKGPWVIRRTH